MAKNKIAPLDAKVADKLLDLLSTDNEFRRLFKKDPAAALVKAGHRDAALSPDAAVASCYSATHIASKQEIAKARTQLQAYLTSALAPSNPHCFEAGKVISSLSRVAK
ncbi:MAG TPA: NHLP-related RiPP peptide [Lysobacter sp.]